MPELKKKTFDIVAAVKLHCESAYFLRRKTGAYSIIIRAVDTIAAVKNTLISKKDLQKRDTTSISSKTVTYAACFGIAYSFAVILTVNAA